MLNINAISISKNCFSNRICKKHQLVIHSTHSMLDVFGYVRMLEKEKKQAPAYMIDRDGSIYNLYDPDGCSEMINAYPHELVVLDNHELNEGAIHIALANADALVLDDKKLYPFEGDRIPDKSHGYVKRYFEYCPQSTHRGFVYYEMITDAQVNSLRELLVYLLRNFKIKFRYDNQLGNVCAHALRGHDGIFFNNSFSKYVRDIHPQTNLVRMIKYLNV